ncbi:semaphorin-4C [Synchiropus splendidus]|uniref:semaphorin-4C n=1 Tax=Synchiropus splendidus TaxID=270530 RepID=UPI00237E1DA3|nr:semaphorin-4C [Synchiropus splendidus]XP_053725831.1 semaphorin-4C [Synchiropus splendidus]XP_053725832.1 semaphorin-4C [Synchiropus splendidus]
MRPDTRGMDRTKVLLLMFLLGLELCQSLNWNPIPRKTVRYQDVLDSMARFSVQGVSNYSMLTLSDHERVLYIGAREALFALDPNDISRQLRPQIDWPAPQDKKRECVTKGKSNQTECFNYIRFLQSYNHTHLYTCGTYAFQPKCTYVNADYFTLNSAALEDGKGKCPYDPAKGHTGLIVDKELYSATLNNFLGTEPVILRNLGQQHYSMKSEYLPAWLNEPDFVGSALVRESSGSKNGDDDKIYFFFSERALELDCDTELTVARVARVCKGDLGGTRTLQKKWTTFQKARLECSLPERHVSFNNLRAVYTLPGQDWRGTTFYGIFHAQWGDVDVSAVCQYQINDVKKVFEGSYKEYRDASQKWGRFSGQVPSPRPGSCITNTDRESGYSSSLQLPDATLNFAKKHPLMEDKALARPLLLTKGVNFTRLVVDRVSGLDQRAYNMLFIGTAEGWLQRVVVLGTEAHVIEEIQLFESAQPVDSLTISHSKKYVYIGSRSEVLQLPLANCSRYQSQPDCLLARDPYCAWDSEGRACVRIDLHRGSTSSLSQDLTLERFSRGKPKFDKPVSIPSPEHSRLKNVTVVVGSDMVLPCQLVSNLAQPCWLFNDRELLLGDPEAGGPRFDRTLKALVVPEAGQMQAGRYICYSEEQGVKFQTERYQVAVVASAPVFMEARAPDSSMGLFWVLVITLGAACLLLLVAALYLRRRLKLALGKGADMKPLESTLVYPITLPKEPPTFVPSKMPSDEERFWETGANYYYSDGSLKIVPGHALGPSSVSSTASPSAIPGQPIHSPSRLSLTNIRGSGSNGYIRLNLSTAGEERASGAGAGGGGLAGLGMGGNDYSSPFKEELRRTLQQRSVLPDANPEESSV